MISKKFTGRTQHTVKNRFIVLIGREFLINRDKTRELVNGKELMELVKRTLLGLTIQLKLEWEDGRESRNK